MKRSFSVTLNVMAYSLKDAEAKVELLVQMGAFVKDFNVNNLAGSIIKSFVVSKVSEFAEKKKLQSAKEKEGQAPLFDIAFSHSKIRP